MFYFIPLQTLHKHAAKSCAMVWMCVFSWEYLQPFHARADLRQQQSREHTERQDMRADPHVGQWRQITQDTNTKGLNSQLS